MLHRWRARAVASASCSGRWSVRAYLAWCCRWPAGRGAGGSGASAPRLRDDGTAGSCGAAAAVRAAPCDGGDAAVARTRPEGGRAPPTLCCANGLPEPLASSPLAPRAASRRGSHAVAAAAACAAACGRRREHAAWSSRPHPAPATGSSRSCGLSRAGWMAFRQPRTRFGRTRAGSTVSLTNFWRRRRCLSTSSVGGPFSTSSRRHVYDLVYGCYSCSTR